MGSFDGIRKANERAARLEQKHVEKRKASEAKQAERAQADAAKKVAAGGRQPQGLQHVPPWKRSGSR